jgi:hypothetical protein
MRDLGDTLLLCAFVPYCVGAGLVFTRHNLLANAICVATAPLSLATMACYASSYARPNAERRVALGPLRARVVGPIVSGARDPVVVRMPRVYFGE